MISRRPTEIRIRSDSTNSLPSRDTPIHCYSKQTEPYSRVPSHINPPSTYMHPPLEYTQPPPHVRVPTSGYATPHGYSVLPPEANRPTSSDSRTVTHNPIDSQPSSSSTSQLGMSSLCLHGNGSEPNTPTTNQSATAGQGLTQVGVRDMQNRLVIEPDGYTFNPDDAVGIISQAIKDLYRDAFPTWGKMPSNLKRQIFLEFRKKCTWRPEHETKICANFHKKAARVLTSLLMKARKKNKNPRWILPEDKKKLLVHWANDPRFKQMSEIGKKARSSTKGGSLHTSGAQSQGNLIGGPSRYGYAYGMPQQTFREYHSEFEGLSSSYDDESMKKTLAMEQKIAELSSQVEDSRARERRRDIEYAVLRLN
ncbi:hypothetical protein H5410_044279 [Solanum commersonii]|uniref:Uncharacterized protein n=1 Tax=Solanum commersonii TaxID=4109 RepID=A0A9J5X8M4_SOLCO|nr:hypothetical protein H5410_044279 [Solanum commersonii]